MAIATECASTRNAASRPCAVSLFTQTFGGILSVGFSPDNKMLALADTNGTVRLPLALSAVNSQNAAGILASSSTDTTIKLWDMHTGRCLRTLSGHHSYVWSVAWSPIEIVLPTGTGQLLATAGSMNDLTIRLWNPEGECLRILSEHQGLIWWVSWNPDGKSLATASDDRRVKLWDVQTGECIKSLHDNRLMGLAIA